MRRRAYTPRGDPPAPQPSAAAAQDLDARLRRLEFDVRRRVDGLLQGNHLGLLPGPGSEPGEARAYQPGDDVRRMEWAVTARTTVPHIRTTVADRELETWLAIDQSASMDFGTETMEKRDLALAAAAAFAHLTRGGGNRIGAVLAPAAGQPVRIPACGGQAAVTHLLRRIALTPRQPPGQRGDIVLLLEQLRRPERRRGLVVVVSDFLGEITWERPLRALVARHDVIAVSISDPRDRELPAVGTVTLTDPETGRSRRVWADAALRRRFADAAAEQRAHTSAALRRAGAAHLALSTERDWVRDLVRFVLARKRGWGGEAARVS